MLFEGKGIWQLDSCIRPKMTGSRKGKRQRAKGNGCNAASGVVQVNGRVARRREQRLAADAVQQALLQAKAHEQEQFEAIKTEFGVDTSTVR